MAEVLDIACDEAGHTGPDLLNQDQRVFAFSTVALDDNEAFAIISEARKKSPVAMPELKASKLLKSERGRRLIVDVFMAIEDRYAISVFDKLLSLCGWFFEYIFEPVYQEHPEILYRKDMHRFVAMYAYIWMLEDESGAKIAIGQFQKYMRSRDPRDAPFLFDNPRSPLGDDGAEHPFETVLRFAYGYRDIIIADNSRLDRELPEDARWILDLSTSALWSHLNHWGQRSRPIRVHCDSSKPLNANSGAFLGDETDAGIQRAQMNGHKGVLGWKFFEPIKFCDSRNHPAIQLADIVAGAAVAFASGSLLEGCETIAHSLDKHMLRDSIWPDMDVVNPQNRKAAVNALMLYDLAKRSELQGDPYENLALKYRLAELDWAKGNSPYGYRP